MYIASLSRHMWLNPALPNLLNSVGWASFHRFSLTPILRVNLLPFTLSISPPVHPSSIVLSWANYNSKNSKLNGSASLFGRKRRLPLESTHPANQMACPRTRCNPPPAGKDELARRTLFEGSGIPTPTPAASRAPTPAHTQDPIPVPGLPDMYTNIDLQRATSLALELFVKGQEHGQANSASRKRAFKARNFDLYYRNLHMECYYFCQQCEDHFDTAGATGYQYVPFAALFLRDRINFRWQQHKTQVERDRVASLTWDEFKAFLRQSLKESTVFVNNIWDKIKQDFQH